MAFEIQRASEKFEEIWNERDQMNYSDLFHMIQGENYDSIWIFISNDEFIDLAFRQKAADGAVSLDITFRIVYKNGKGALIDGLSQTITLTVNADVTATNPCADVTLKKEMDL
jgi:hypothetical protein